MQDHRDTSITRRGFIATGAGLALGAAGTAHGQGQGQAYPARAIRVIVPFPAGAGADSNARLVSQQLAEKLGQPVVVDNRPGANGLIGTEAVAKAAPDGYTLLFVDRGALGINPSLYKKLPYDPLKDFSYVGIAVWGPYVLVAGSKQSAKTIQELVAAARKQPGHLTYASFGNGSMTQLGTESLCSRLGMQLTHVPYKGGAPALTAAMAGEVDMALVTIGPALGAIREGRVRPLLVGGSHRFRCCRTCLPSARSAATRTPYPTPISASPCPPARPPRSATAFRAPSGRYWPTQRSAPSWPTAASSRPRVRPRRCGPRWSGTSRPSAGWHAS